MAVKSWRCVPSGMGTEQIVIVFVGALAAGVVNGMTGFGTALTALGIWLYAISPATAATLVILCSTVSQLQTMHLIWRSIVWRRVLIFILPGIFGVPIGTVLLPHVNAEFFKIGVGGFLVAYTLYVLTRRVEIKSEWGGGVADGAVGFIGGVLGGLAGLSGVIPVVWTDVRGWTKEQRRSVLQTFNMSILTLALVSHAVGGLVTRQVLLAAIVALPATVAGAWAGGYIYRLLHDHTYQRVIMVLLLLSGIALIWTSV
jgi:uncharacterized membrane protein YfcA